MDTNHKFTIARLGGIAAIAAAIFMIAGAVLKVVSGADLDQALATGNMSDYLAKAAQLRHLLLTNLSLWIAGVFGLGIAGTAMANLCKQNKATTLVVKLCYYTGVPLAIASFVAWITLVVHLSPEPVTADSRIAEAVGLFVSRADWIATVLVVGAGPALISFSGRGDWVPAWLLVFGGATALTAVLTVIAMFTYALTSYGFLIVPVGLAWMIAAGIVLLGREKT
jgi:hypothetical protein